MLISENEARRLLEKHLPELRQFFIRALERYQAEYQPSARADHDASIQAACIHGHVVSEASKYAERFPDSEVKFEAPGNCGMLIFGGRIAVRFKKFDARLQPSNNETPQSRSFTGSTISEKIPASATLDCGYQLNALGDSIIGVFVVDRITAAKPHWVMEISEAEIRTTVTPLFEAQQESVEEATPAAIVPRKSEVVELRPVKKDD